ncbi:hypothetical protein F9288_07355 [Sphingomonas sp. CL5.1]|uniref:hypothetical protein n=1 Tax=Sphingomonas sp. CL5.1 TaxID=2653203 RepID=UPI0015834449|nr:hypothetical protein [Sphingomonas sp. CL5.1]QKR99478.1 hypothetical protein F9288_07355 [Sphingomonas sp. CL5.1]
MRRILTGLAIATAMLVGRPASAEAAFDNPVDDATLASSYGKFLAPGGIDLAMSVQSSTTVNGNLVLRSVFSVDRGPGTLQVFAPPSGSSGPEVSLSAAAGTGNVQSNMSGSQGVSVSVDRATGTTIIQPTHGSAVTPVVSVNSAQISVAAPADNSGLVQVTPAAAGVETGAGVVSVTAVAAGARVTLDGAGFSISHLVGAATGAVIANTANDRVIDTVTNVQIDLHNAQAMALGSAMLRVDSLVSAATRAMFH